MATTACPKSVITAESLALLEEYHAWKWLGQGSFRNLSARQVDAFFTLENEAAKGG